MQGKEANGWKAYRTDEANRAIREKDPGYQRWKSMSGYGETDDPIYKPAVNWSVDENNTFGYLYGENKQRAYDYAKAINSRLSRRMERIGSSLREGAQEQREKSANFWEDVWNTYTKAQSANSTAHEKSAEQIGNAGKAVGERIKAGAQASAQVQIARGVQAQEQASGLSEIAHDVMQRFGESMQSYGEAMKIQADRQREAHIQVGKYSGVTGADYVSESVCGYLEDDSWKKPTSDWKPYQLEEHRILMTQDPELAETYAAGVNEGYNRANLDENLKGTGNWATQNILHGVLGSVGAVILNQFSPAEALDTEIEYQTRGTITTNPDGTPMDHANAITSSIADKLNNYGQIDDNIPYIGGMKVGELYQVGMDAVSDALPMLTPIGSMFNAVKATSDAYIEALQEAKEKGAKDDSAMRYAKIIATSKGASDKLIDTIFRKWTEKYGEDRIVQILEGVTVNGTQAIADTILDEALPNGTRRDDGRTSQEISKETGKRIFREMLRGGLSKSLVKEK